MEEQIKLKADKWDKLEKKLKKYFKGERDLYTLEDIIKTTFKL